MAAWASLTADEELGYVFVPLSTPTASYYGGHRPGMNLYSDSLLALNAKTGKLVWYYQLIHHDLWEYDAATPPVLGDITVDGKRIKADRLQQNWILVCVRPRHWQTGMAHRRAARAAVDCSRRGNMADAAFSHQAARD
jgi:hypothetical protein